VQSGSEPFGLWGVTHGLYSISSGMLLQDVTMNWPYLTSNGFKIFVASVNLYFDFVIN
jgi:hypothetical protein